MGRALFRNVIRSKRAIKGLGSPYPQNIAQKACRDLNAPTVVLFFEQLFSGRTMGSGAIDVGFHAGNLRLQGFDAGVKFLDRDGVEILFCKLRQGIAGLAGKEIVQVHVVNR
jgi:hypothetical protein